MSRVLHRVLLDKLIAPLPYWAELNPPILLNSWEAKYFDINHTNIVEMAKQVPRKLTLAVYMTANGLVFIYLLP